MLEEMQSPIAIATETAPPNNTKVALYNADAQQKFVFVVEDDEAKYELTQIFKGVPDNAVLEYDRLRQVLMEGEGANTDLNTDSMNADEYLFNELCADVLGYSDEKPANWLELIDYDEKRAGINKLLAVRIVGSNKEKSVKKREWGHQRSTHTVELQSYFDGKILTTKARFQSKSPADVAEYALIKNRLGLVDKGLDDSAIKIPAQMKRKAALYDKLNPATEGYDGRVPVHHKAAFVTGFFEPKISSGEKK